MVLGIILSVLELVKDPVIYVFSPIKRHISYAFKCDSKVQTLQGEAEKLKNKKDLLQQSVLEATRNGEGIYDFVDEWLISAQNKIEEADEIVQGKDEAMKKCFAGFCPNLKTRYQLGKKAHKKALAVGKKLQDAPGSDPISFRPPLQQIVEPSVYTSEALPSRVLILDQIMAALEDPNLNMVGVYGMGGVGKTRLAKEVQGKAVEKKLFEDVILVPVSQTQDLRRIQGEIADFMGLKFHAEEVPGRASQLQNRLKKANVLIILDDVWQKLDLNAVGIPFGDAAEGCKILLTSRRKEILSRDMCTQKEFSLDVLKEEETWRLFEKSVGHIEDPELRQVATEIAEKCAGLPLLILIVAADLRNKDSYAWNDTRKQLSRLGDSEIYEKVHRVIESSYEKLTDEAKSLFLLCALFGNANIEIHKLLIYSVGLGLFNLMDSIEDSRNRVLRLVAKLKDESLLLDGDRAGFVKIHDVVRDIALAIASREQHAFVGTSKVRSIDLQNKDYTRISLPYADICELPEVIECPEAEVFSLFVKEYNPYIPDSLFMKVTKLKVVDLYGVYFVSRLPSSLGVLVGLQTLCLERCWFNNVAIVAELKQLEVLSFAKSNIEELPRELKGLTRLKVLDLRGCWRLGVIPANVLSNLRLLEELYILRTEYIWEAEGNASLVELRYLPNLTTLEIEVNDDELLPEDWFFNGVRNYKISIGDGRGSGIERYETPRRILILKLRTRIGLMDRIKEFVSGIEVLELRNTKGVENLFYDSDRENLNSLEKKDGGELGKGYFGKLGILKIKKCETLKSLFSPSFAKCLQQLQEVEVASCGSMEAVIGEGCEDEVIEVTQLTSLRLSVLPNLVGLCKTSGMVCFPNLTSLDVVDCNSMKCVFTTSMVTSLGKLNKLKIGYCELMEEIVSGGHEDEVMEFPRLTFVRLYDLPNLKSFSKTSEMVSFPNLTSLDVFNCKSMKYLFTASMVKSLKHLEDLWVSDCESMEEIIKGDKFEEKEEVGESISRIVFPKIYRLGLYDLQSLKRFSSRYPIDFPSLRELTIKGCSAMENSVSKVSNGSNTNLFNELLVRNVEDLKLDRRGLKALQIEVDLPLNLKTVTLARLRQIDIPILFGFLRRIDSLELLFFTSCNFELDDDEGDVGDEKQKCHLTLKHLRLNEVSNLKHILKEDSVLNPVLQHLHSISVEHCVDLMNLASFAASFQNLTTLHVGHCHQMTSLVTASTAKTMVELVELKVSSCRMMEEIVAKDSGCMEHDVIIFNKLKLLELENLERLNSFCSGNYSFSFPLLEQATVQDCSRMKTFCSGNVSTPKLPGIKFNRRREQLRKGDLNATISCELREWVGKPIFPNQLQLFNGLRKLVVRDCNWVDAIFNLEELSAEHGNVHLLPELHELELINLPMLTQLCNKAPRGILEFNNLRVLKIENCSRLVYAFTWSMASCLFELERIEVKNCEMMETIITEEKEEDVAAQVRLGSLKVRVLKIKNCSRLRYAFTWSVASCLFQLREIEVKNCEKMETIIKGEEAEVAAAQLRLGSLNSILLESLPKFSSFYPGRGDLECPSLKKISIRECPAIKVLTVEDKVFSYLEELSIDIKSITSIMQVELPSNFFSNLKTLGLVYSSGSTVTKSHVPLLHFLSILPNLHRLGVNHSSVQELFKFDGLSCRFTREAMSKLSQVRDLMLYSLDDMKQIWWQSSEFHASLFQSLETLEVISCGQIVSLASSAASFQNLTRLKVYECNQLRNLITASVAKSMVQLETLRVESCEMLMEIVGHGNDGTSDEIVFTKLNTLELIDLESLEGFCLGNYAFEFPCLENILVLGCPNIRIFRSGIIQAPMLTYVNYSRLHRKGDLNSPIKHLYKKMVGFEDMTYLKLSQFPVLKEQWAAQFPLGCFISLERLVVDDCAVFSSAVSSHLLHRLEKLKELVVEKCDSVEQVFDLEGLNADNFELKNLKELQLIDLPRLRDAWSKIPQEILSFENLQLLRIHNCGNLTRIFDLSMALSLPVLQLLEVKNCSLLKHIIVKEDEESTMQQQFQTIFRSLETMNLQYLTNFSSFYSTSGFLKCPSLKFVEVVQCPKMGLFAPPDSCMIIKEKKGKITAEDPHSMAAFLGNTIKIPKLEELKVEWNSLMIELNNNNQLEFLSGLKLIHLTSFDGEYAVLPPQLLLNFPQLKKLTLSDASMEEINFDELSILHNERAESVGLLTALVLSNLPKLKNLVSDDSQPVALFQKLEDLEVSECSRLSILVPSLVSFQNLTSLQVTKCDGMKNLITASTARSLVQIKRMNVKDCKMMQEIVAIDSDRVEYEIRFSLLEHLELDHLPCLASFCSGDYDLFFPSLVEMVVIHCPSTKIFSEKDSIAPKLWKVQTGRCDYEWEGSLNNTIKALFMEKHAEEMDA